MSVCSARLFVRSLALSMNKAFVHVSGVFLHEQWVSRRLLSGFASGKVLPLAPGLSDCVEVRINGKLLALGELVQLEDRWGLSCTRYITTVSFCNAL